MKIFVDRKKIPCYPDRESRPLRGNVSPTGSFVNALISIIGQDRVDGFAGVTAGVPAVLFSRLITGPVAVIIAYFFSFGLY
jgi:hypothetical protein